MRQRRFEIIRKPDLEGSSFLFNNVQVRYVGTCPETGISFYCSNGHGGTVGVRVYPCGRKALENAYGVKYNKPYAHGKAEYLYFKSAFGNHKGIYAHHAVYLAWVEPFAEPCIDHKNGVTTDNRYQNLEPVTFLENARRVRILNGLRQIGINPASLPFSVLDKYLDPKNACDPLAAAAEERRKYADD